MNPMTPDEARARIRAAFEANETGTIYVGARHMGVTRSLVEAACQAVENGEAVMYLTNYTTAVRRAMRERLADFERHPSGGWCIVDMVCPRVTPPLNRVLVDYGVNDNDALDAAYHRVAESRGPMLVVRVVPDPWEVDITEGPKE